MHIEGRKDVIDILNLAAQKKLKVGDDWKWCESEKITGGFLLMGAKTIIEQKSEKHKWIKPMEKVLITDNDLIEIEMEYERTTGKCYVCEGSGQELCGWSKKEGKRFRPCKRCMQRGSYYPVPNA